MSEAAFVRTIFRTPARMAGVALLLLGLIVVLPIVLLIAATWVAAVAVAAIGLVLLVWLVIALSPGRSYRGYR